MSDEVLIGIVAVGWLLPMLVTWVFAEARSASWWYVVLPLFFGPLGLVAAILWYLSNLSDWYIGTTLKNHPNYGKRR
ncbi:MAG: hypothetical protein OXI33_04200 [Chloroflexota bacterium]|nr:hypothetical protein [Chloroflexota bacterium]